MNQNLTIVEQLKNLEQIQQIDLQIDLLKKNQTEMPEGVKKLNLSIAQLQSSHNLKIKSLADLQKSQSQAQAALDINQSRLTRASAKLDLVKNSHEFQAASKEKDQLKKLNESLTEQINKSNSEIEMNEKESKDLSEKMKNIQSDVDEKMMAFQTQNKSVSGEISELDTKKKNYLEKIELRLFNQYNRIRVARNGVGASCLVMGRCKACNMIIPSQMYNEIQKGNVIHSCPSCNRILFISAEKPAEENLSEDKK